LLNSTGVTLRQPLGGVSAAASALVRQGRQCQYCHARTQSIFMVAGNGVVPGWNTSLL
jgi:hypothetical protein